MASKANTKGKAGGSAAPRKGSTKKAGSRAPAAKGNTTRKKTVRSGAQTASKPVSREKEFIDYAIYYEIFLWIVLAVSVLIFLSLLGMGGTVGKGVSSVCFGMFGVMAYVLPFFLFFLTAFLISNSRSFIAKIKSAGAVVLFIVLCGFMQMILVGYNAGYALSEYYEAGAQYHVGGGLTGGALAYLFAPALGVVGTYLVLAVLAVICLVLITQRAVFAGMGRKGRRLYAHAVEERSRRLAWKEEQELRRMEDSWQEEEKNKTPRPVTFSILPKEEVSTRDPVRRTDSRRTGTDERRNRPRAEKTVLQKEPVRLAPAVSMDGWNLPADQGTEPEADRYIDLGRAVQQKIPVEKLLGPLDDQVMSIARQDPENDVPEADPQTEEAAKKAVSRKPKATVEEIQEGISSVEAEIAAGTAAAKPEYVFPPLKLLKKPARTRNGTSDDELRETAQKLQQVFQTFGVNVRITNVSCGPSVTRYELMPEMGVKVSKIVSLQDDIMLNLAASDIRIEAPIPGKAAVGIEVPNAQSSSVLLRELLESDTFTQHPSDLAYAVGKDIAGKIIVSDIAKMPHLLIAGATGSGKSVFINTLIMSILYKASPNDVKLIMIDPKVVELSVYNGIPHLYIPVVTDPKKAAGALSWAVAEMDQRYKKFAEIGVRDLKGYNRRVEALKDVEDPEKPEKMPRIVIIVDELADLMMVSSKEVEEAICRLAQLARACGIHLVIATQRPSVDVITGLIKANMPSRIAFSVSSGVDSRTILDMNGAERLLGNGDMLFAPQTYKQPLRVQGAFVSDAEVAQIVEFLKEKNVSEGYEKQMEERLEQVATSASSSGGGDVDPLFADAGKLIIEKDKASIGALQRYFKIGFNRAARIMDQLSDAGVVGPEEGTKPRKVLMSPEQFEEYLEQN